MSELQIALLAIGVGVVVAIYFFNWWKQRQYSRKFDSAFRHSHDDALYQTGSHKQHTIEGDSDQLESKSEGKVEHRIVMPDMEEERVTLEPEELVAEAADEILQPVMPAASALSEACTLLESRSDYIIELHLAEPATAAVLDGLWQRKFDFRKPVQVCGQTLNTGEWDRVIAESHALYSRFRIALQLVDRGGAISVAKLGDFRDLVLGIAQSIHADTTVPDILDAHNHAIALDGFCAEVDQMVGVNMLPNGDRLLNGAKIASNAALHGMKLESDGAFHLMNAQGHSQMTLTNKDTKPFQPHALENFTTAGIQLMLDVPRVDSPVAAFDHMLSVAHALARDLQVNLVDDHRVMLTEGGLAQIRTQIAEVEERMRENGLIPGGAQARRLFS